MAQTLSELRYVYPIPDNPQSPTVTNRKVSVRFGDANRFSDPFYTARQKKGTNFLMCASF